MERPEPRTLLEWLVQQGDRTQEEICADFERCARHHNERSATLSIRQLGRWMAGEVDNARPASRRVAQQLWGYSFKKLLGPPDAGTEAVAQAEETATVVRIISTQEIRQETKAFPVSWHEEVMMAAEESARFVRRAGVTVTPEVLEQLDTDVKMLAIEYRRRPPYASFRPLAGLRRDVFDMIDRHPQLTYLPGLYRVAGQLSALLAHTSFSLGQPDAADSHARTALLCADLAGDETLRPYIRWVQSCVAYGRSDYRDAADLAQSGQRFAGQGNDLVRLASQEARALAATGNDREADRALGVATNARDHATEGARPVGHFFFPPGVAANNASDARLALGGEPNARLAISAAQEALELFTTPEGGHSLANVAISQLDLVAAQLALHDLDGASVQAQAVLQLPSEYRTAGIIRRIAKIDQALADEVFGNTTLASDLREQITVFSAYPAARDLPPLTTP
ncbi:MAG: hypothetical protein ACRDRX_11460 [Pseudonocardiaceae bacterium]